MQHVDRFRSILSLLGISIGVFTTFLVFTLADGLRQSLQHSLQGFGDRMVLVQSIPWSSQAAEDGRAWWSYLRRPPVLEEEADYLRRHADLAQGVAYVQTFYRSVSSRSEQLRSVLVTAASGDWFRLFDYPLQAGRIFTGRELQGGSPVALVGSELAETLFPGGSALGASLRVGGQSVTVVGVFEEQGESLLSLMEVDRMIVIPPAVAARAGVSRRGGYVAALPQDGVESGLFDAQLRGLMRSKRRLSPWTPDDFSLNRMGFVQETVDEISRKVRRFGGLIGGFSLLIGGFGIANVLLVSVKERTREIGIRKALGATHEQIRRAFLKEAAALSLLGGLAGIGLAAAVVGLLGDNGVLPLQLSWINVVQCLAIAGTIGVLAGWLPACSASRLDPVQAISRTY